MTSLTPFHIAFPVDDLAAARNFYGGVPGCAEGRRSDMWIDFEPYIRFKGEAGEQATMFFFDPAGNALEFKALRDMGKLFAT
jgi:extradiol dioxygenase family protein